VSSLVAVVLIALAVLALMATLVIMVKVLPEYERGVVYRLGRVLPRPKGPGLIFLLPFGIERMYRVNLQNVTMNIPPQDVITKGNIRIRVDMVVHTQVVDPLRAVVLVQNYLFAVSQAAQTNLQVLLGKYELGTLLAERERINRELSELIDTAAADWGVKVSGAEIRNIDWADGEHGAFGPPRGQRPAEAEAPLNESMEGITGGPGSLAQKAARDIEAAAKQEVQEQARRVPDPRIFLCYRREDSQGFARGIYESLAAKYSPEQVYRDIDSTPPGVRYSTWIESRIDQCHVMIVLIGPAWSTAKDQAGQRRLELPKDWVREEIAVGLRRGIPILPVCVQGARMPSEDELPPSIVDLAGFQSTEVTDSRWDFDIKRLLQAIDNLISSDNNE
jgi:hypothetical protein